MHYICTNLAGLEAEHGYKVKLKVLTLLNFLTLSRFPITLLSCNPGVERIVFTRWILILVARL